MSLALRLRARAMRAGFVAASFALAMFGFAGNAEIAHAQEVRAVLDDPTGFWLVAETGPPVSSGLAAIPIFGAAARAQIGNPRAVWDVRREADNSLSIQIRPRDLLFRNVAIAGDAVTAETIAPDNPNARVRLDVRIANGQLSGTLAFEGFTLSLDGRPPPSVVALREALVAARTRLDEIDGPYAIPEIEKLRLENIVLIERIRRVEGELAARNPNRGATAASPAPSAAVGGQIAMRGLGLDLQTRTPARLRSAPDGSAPQIAALPAGQPLAKLADAARSGWSLVATAQGTVGYVATGEVSPLAQAASPAGATRAAREISVSFPSWDPGRIGRRMTVPEPGFISLVGRVRGDGNLREVRIADAQTVSNRDGSFTAVVPVERDGRRVRIEAVFAAGPPAILEFEIVVGR
ncbi:MAG: SH3 domain-containing protein [Telmatospirillum sp.]|nr:SH3 domain-containing protein [Telmatospirillum sp.]